MSQEDIRLLLDSLRGEATHSELSQAARKRYPNRTLHSYVTQLLKSMEKKGYVEKIKDESNRTVWKLTQKGRESRIGGYGLNEIDDLVSLSDLEKEGFEVTNIVGSFEIGRPIDLMSLSSDLEGAEYHPETNSSMVYRINGERSITILAHTSGRESITGAKDRSDLQEARDRFISELEELGIETNISDEEIIVQNIVSTYNFGREFDLSALSIGLGLENIEYEPEQFPGLIYRTEIGPTVLIFNSGKCVITGAKTYLQVQDSLRKVKQAFTDIGVEV